MTPQQVREWRTRHFATQEEAGQALDLSRRTIIKYENGQQEVPKTVRLAMAAIALGLKDYPPQ